MFKYENCDFQIKKIYLNVSVFQVIIDIFREIYAFLWVMLAVAYATGRASHARKVKGDDPNKKGYPGPQVGGLAWG